MTPEGETIRCYSCGAREDPSLDECSKCDAPFQRLCTCGARISLFVARCPTCKVPTRRVRQKRRRIRVKPVLVTLAIVGAGVAAGLVWKARASRVSPWRAKNDALAHYAAGRFEPAARAFESITKDSPGDAQSLYMLGASYKALELPPDSYLKPVRDALVHDPSLVEALCFLAAEELDRGRIDAALDYAEKADSSRNASARAAELVAAAQLRMARPDDAAALAALLRAKARGSTSPDLALRIAELRLRAVGPIRPELFPPDLVNALREAEAALSRPETAEGVAPERLAVTRARLKLLLGSPEEALRLADSTLASMKGVDPVIRAQLLLVRAGSLAARGGPEAASADLASALQASPDAETAAAVAAVVRESGDSEALFAILTRAAEKSDPKGAIHAVLADMLRARGSYDEALRALATARQADAGNPRLDLLEGDVLAGQRQFAEARQAFTRASQKSPRFVDPKVRLELLALDEPTEGASREQDFRAAVGRLEAMRAEFGENGAILSALGTFRLALGDVRAARDAFDAATKVSPGNPALWLALARAWRESYDKDSLDHALQAFRQARTLAPGDGAAVAEEAYTRLLLGDSANAVVAATSFLSSHPRDIPLLRLRARGYRDLGQWRQAADDLRTLLAAEPNDEAALIDLIGAEFRSGDSKAALALIEDAKGRVSPQTLALLDIIGPLQETGAAAAIERLALKGPSTILAELQLHAGRVDDAAQTARALLESDRANFAAARLLVFALLETKAELTARSAEARGVIEVLPASAPRGLRELLVGRVLLSEGKYADATTQLRAATASMPGDAFAQLCLGESLVRGASREEGLSVLRRAASMPGAPITVGPLLSRRLADAAAESKNARTGESLAIEALHVDPLNAAAAELLAAFLHGRGEFRAAAEVAERALTMEGVEPEAGRRLRQRAIVSRLCAGDTERAVAQLEGLAPDERETPFAVTVRGFAHLKAGRFAEAEAVLRTLAFEGDGSQVAVVGLVQAALGRADAKRALQIVAEWRSIHPSDRDVPLAASRIFAAGTRFNESVEAARIGLSARPGDRACAGLVVDGLAHQGRRSEAVDAARRFAATAPEDARTALRLLLAAAMVKYGGDAEEGLRVAREFRLRADLSDEIGTEAAVIEAEALLVLDKDADAEGAADALTRGWVADRPVTRVDVTVERRIRFVLGTVAARSGRLGPAVTHFSRCVELDPHDVSSANNLAWALTKSGAGDRALATARRVTTLDATIADFWDTRAQAAQAVHDVTDADASWARALEISGAERSPEAALYAPIALRYLGFLDAEKRSDDARRIAQSVVERFPGTAAAATASGYLAR